MKTPVDQLLPLLARVRETSRNCWIASCPGPLHANGDRQPSLSIKETGDGTLLLHCYAGCETSSLLQAIGLTLFDLFPEGQNSGRPPLPVAQRKRYGQALDALGHLSMDCMIVCIAADRLLASQALDAEELAQVNLARERIMAAVEIAA